MEVGQLLCGWQVKETIRLLLKWDVCASKLTNATFALRMNLTRDPKWHGSDGLMHQWNMSREKIKSNTAHWVCPLSPTWNTGQLSFFCFFFFSWRCVTSVESTDAEWARHGCTHGHDSVVGHRKQGWRHRKLGKTRWKRCLAETAAVEKSTTAGFSPGRGYVTVSVNEAFPNWFRTFPS